MIDYLYKRQSDMSNLVNLENGNAVTTSLAIAEGVGNSHSTVIRLVRDNLSDLEEFGLVGFQIQPKKSGVRGGSDTHYAVLNEQQATLLMTYMRNNAIVKEFKKRLVKAFYEMNQVRTPAEQLLVHAQRLVDQERKIAALEESQHEVKSQVKALIDGEGYFTVVGYCNKNKIKVDSKAAQRIGKSVAKICRENEWETGTANHPLYGEVKTYPEEAIEEAIKH